MLLLCALTLAIVTTVLFITIGESAPNFNMPPKDAPEDYSKEQSERERRRRERESQRYNQQRQAQSQSPVSNIQPVPVAPSADAKGRGKGEGGNQGLIPETMKNRKVGAVPSVPVQSSPRQRM